MIGFLLIAFAIMQLAMLSFGILLNNFQLFIMLISFIAMEGIGVLFVFSGLWEFWVKKPVKALIGSRSSSFGLKFDDLGWFEIIPSKTYLPGGLVQYKFGWALLPRPIVEKVSFIQNILAKKRGRPPKDLEQRKSKELEFQQFQKQELEKARNEQALAEQLSLKKYTWKGLGKPVWVMYEGIAMNFNPSILVPGEAKQDNPDSYFRQMKGYIDTLNMEPTMKEDLKSRLDELNTKVHGLRVVLDPRRVKEVIGKIYTQAQIEDHGRIHFELGRLSVSGMPMGKILIIMLVVLGVIGAIAALYFLVMKPGGQMGLIFDYLKNFF